MPSVGSACGELAEAAGRPAAAQEVFQREQEAISGWYKERGVPERQGPQGGQAEQEAPPEGPPPEPPLTVALIVGGIASEAARYDAFLAASGLAQVRPVSC